MIIQTLKCVVIVDELHLNEALSVVQWLALAPSGQYLLATDFSNAEILMVTLSPSATTPTYPPPLPLPPPSPPGPPLYPPMPPSPPPPFGECRGGDRCLVASVCGSKMHYLPP